MREVGCALITFWVVILGLVLANWAYDINIPQYVSRKIGHFFGGVAYLLATIFFSDPWIPLGISTAFTLGLFLSRVVEPDLIRGVGGSSRKHTFAEVWFPLAGTISLGVGWVWLDSKWLATVPILFMAWGDCVTGLIRARVYGREVKGNWGSLGMVMVCMSVALMFHPYWVGVVGATVATLAERFTPRSRGLLDDNYTIVISSLMIMAALS